MEDGSPWWFEPGGGVPEFFQQTGAFLSDIVR